MFRKEKTIEQLRQRQDILEGVVKNLQKRQSSGIRNIDFVDAIDIDVNKPFAIGVYHDGYKKTSVPIRGGLHKELLDKVNELVEEVNTLKIAIAKKD